MRRAIAIAALLWAAPAVAASAGKDSPVGRYALDAASCAAKDYFATLAEATLALPTFSCKGVDYDQTENKGGRALYAVSAKACSGEEAPKPRAEKFSLVVEAGGLQILWRDGTKSARLTRCAGK